MTTIRRMLMLMVVGVAVVAGAACDNSVEPPPPREPRTIFVPTDMSLEEAADSALAGDTLIVTFSTPPITSTLEFDSSQTPLVVRGFKDAGPITGIGVFPLIRFSKPKPGTRVEGLFLSGGSSGLVVEGPGTLLVCESRFYGAETQIFGSGTGLNLDLSGNLFRDADQTGVEFQGGGAFSLVGNTIAAAGDRGVVIGSATEAEIRNNIIWRSGSYGIVCENGLALADTSGCNDVFESGVEGYLDCLPGDRDFSLSPMFCDPDNGDFSLLSISPCAPINSGGCGLIGALPVGCDPEPLPTGTSDRPLESR